MSRPNRTRGGARLDNGRPWFRDEGRIGIPPAWTMRNELSASPALDRKVLTATHERGPDVFPWLRW